MRMQATSRFKTAHSRKYLQQLCKHFAHKVDVTFTETRGECRFSCGTSFLDADPDALSIRVEAASEEDLRLTRAVVEDHLLRFAFREAPSPLVWHMPA